MTSLTFDTVGFFARDVADIDLLANALQVNDDEEPRNEVFELKSSRIAFCQSPLWSATEQSSRGQSAWLSPKATVADSDDLQM